MKLMIVYGTRPELIKLASFIYELQSNDIEHILVNTGQHRDMVDKTSKQLSITPHYNLKTMKHNQSLNHIITSIMNKIGPVIDKEKPTHIVSFADTASALAGALSAYNNQIPIIHFEGGVRSGNKYGPFPEEGYRTTEAPITKEKVVITMHRREDWGKPIQNICRTIKKLAYAFPDVPFHFVMHPNPKLKTMITQILNNIENVHLVQNLGFTDFINLLSQARLVMTDSGGMLQESIFLRKPVVYLRKETEYPLVFDNDMLVETGKDANLVFEHTTRILNTPDAECKLRTEFGDGNAGRKAVKWLLEKIQ